MAVNVQGIGNALGAMGAGISGNLPAYMAAQNQEEKLRMEQGELRKKATFEDNRQMLTMASAGDFERPLQILGERVSALTQSGGDPTHSLYMIDLIQRGELDQVIGQFKEMDAIGVGNGYVPAMPNRYIKTEFDKNGVPYGQLPNGQFERIETPARFPSGGGGNVSVDIGGINTGEANQKGADAGQVALAKDAVDYLGTLRDGANSGYDQNINLSSMRNLDVETGLGAEMKMNVARVANFFKPGLGDEIANVSATEAFDALSIEYVQSKLNEATGPQTDLDFFRFQKTFSSLGKTMEANNWLIDNIMASNERKQEQYEFYRDYMRGDPQMGYQTVDDAWIQYKRDVPMVSGNMNAKTGLPYLWSNFQKQTLKENPGAKREEIIALWQELNAGMK